MNSHTETEVLDGIGDVFGSSKCCSNKQPFCVAPKHVQKQQTTTAWACMFETFRKRNKSIFFQNQSNFNQDAETHRQAGARAATLELGDGGHDLVGPSTRCPNMGKSPAPCASPAPKTKNGIRMQRWHPIAERIRKDDCERKLRFVWCGVT